LIRFQTTFKTNGRNVVKFCLFIPI